MAVKGLGIVRNEEMHSQKKPMPDKSHKGPSFFTEISTERTQLSVCCLQENKEATQST